MSARATVDFRALFETEFGYVWSTLRRLGVRERDLPDLTHDTFLRVHTRLDSFEAGRALRPWLFGFAFRVASEYRRLARHRFEVLGEEREIAHSAPLPDEQASQHEATRIAAAALETMDLDRRAVFVLHVIDECPMPDVAAALDIPLNTAYSRLRLAREDFSAAVRRLHPRGGTP
jgi:RNA polymerase sigma-70 factor (ECF subfamily)